MKTARDIGRPLVLGHRGASAHEPGNTLAAYERAMADGADGVELDVRFTSDGCVALIHDPDIAGLGPVVATDFATIRASHPEIPTLDEALAVLEGAVINVEIKNSPSEPDYDPEQRMAGVITRWVDEHDLVDRVVVSSFNPETTAAVGALDPSIVTGQLVAPGADLIARIPVVAAAGHRFIVPFVGDIVSALEPIVAVADQAGIGVVVWTVDDPADIALLGRGGVAAIISNDPAAALAALGAGDAGSG